MTSMTSMTSPQTVLGRRVTFNDSVLDSIYNTINDELYAKNIDRPFQWEEIDGTSVIFLYERIRFVRNRLEKQIACEEFNAKTLRWEPCSSAVAHYMPVMWPLKNANAHNVHELNDYKVSAVVQKYLEKFYQIHPKYLTDPDLKKKVHHLAFVVEKKWQHRCRKSRIKNMHGAVRFWWSNFVDRSVFKTVVSVVGSQTSFPITWQYFADLTRRCDWEKIQSNIQKLGVARKRLAIISPNEWGNVSLQDVVPNKLLGVWGDIEKEPASVQEIFATPLQSSWHTPNLKSIWNAYSQLKGASNEWDIRELNMIVSISQICEETKQFPQKNDIKNLVPYIHSCVKLWRETYPLEYKRWGKSYQQIWVEQAKQILQYSCEKNQFSVPDVYNFELLKSNYEKNLLETVLKNSGVVLNSPQKRRAI